MSILKVDTLRNASGENLVFNNKNLIINGGMNVWQRSTSESSGADTYSTVDRFKTRVRGGAVYTISRSTDVPSAQGFGYSLKFDNTTADASPTSNDFTVLEQRIEGQNLQHLLKGTSSAKKLTLSFHIKSNVTGTYIATLYDNDNNRRIVRTYTIDSVNTWEKKEITFDGDTTGTLDNDTNEGMRLQFWFSAGTNYTSGTLQTTWGASTAANVAPGISNLSSSTSNELYITGIQLETGSAATDFEFEPYETVLRKCQRYFENYSESIGYFHALRAQLNEASDTFCNVFFKVEMRDEPTITITAEHNAGSTNTQAINPKGFCRTATAQSSTSTTRLDGYEADAEL